jgi:hypothetical protein
MMKYIIFTSALLLGSVIAGEALAVDCPISGQVMDISAKAAVSAVPAVAAVAAVPAVTEKYVFTFPTVTKKCSITVGNKTFEADDDSSSDDVVKYFSKNAPSGWTVSNGVFTSTTAGADVADLTYSSSNSKKGKGNCAKKPIIIQTSSNQGVAAVAAVAEVKEVTAVAAVAADPQLTTLLTGKTVCDANATYNNCVKHPGPNCIVTMGIQEQHRSGGQLWDYKMGPSDAIDPTVLVGDWSITGNDADTVVKYAYPPGGTSSVYKVFDAGAGTYYFCSGTTIVATAKITSAPNCS